MKAILHVEPKVTAGLNRGGEDLELNFTCLVEGTELPTEFEVHLNVGDDTDGYSVERLDEEAEDEWARQENAPYNGRAKYTTDHYEFEWEGTPTDALTLVADALKDPNYWRVSHKLNEAPKIRFELTRYVDGNAD